MYTSECSWDRPSDQILNDEFALIDRAQRGDSEAFEVLFRIYRIRIFALARQYFAPGGDRDDLIQEATIGFFKAIRDFRGDRGAFSAFLNLCIRRQIITFIKTATRRKHSALNFAVSLDVPIFADSEETFLGRLASREESLPGNSTEITEFLDTLFARCSKLERGVLSLYAKGFGYAEMAYELGVHYKAVDNAVWRVKVKAKKLLLEKPLDLFRCS